MALTAILIGTAVAGTAAYMVWASSRRHWNAGGEDDSKRIEEEE